MWGFTSCFHKNLSAGQCSSGKRSMKSAMKVQSHLAIGSCSLLAAAVIPQWLGTVRCRVQYGDQLVDPVHQDFRGSKIYVFWHENILLPLFLRGHCNIAMLLSRHADANVLDRVARMMGFGVVRGSTFRGGSTALRELSDRAATESLTITPDGPRGPRRRLAVGCVFLASTLKIPIVAMGFGYDQPWRLGTWDKFAVPRIGSRSRAVVSRPIHVPSNLDREGLEAHRLGVEQILNFLSDDAERWALAGGRRMGDRPVRPEVSRVAKWSTRLEGLPGISLAEEFARLKIFPPVDSEALELLG